MMLQQLVRLVMPDRLNGIALGESISRLLTKQALIQTEVQRDADAGSSKGVGANGVMVYIDADQIIASSSVQLLATKALTASILDAVPHDVQEDVVLDGVVEPQQPLNHKRKHNRCCRVCVAADLVQAMLTCLAVAVHGSSVRQRASVVGLHQLSDAVERHAPKCSAEFCVHMAGGNCHACLLIDKAVRACGSARI